MTRALANDNIVTLLKTMEASPLLPSEQLIPGDWADLLDQLHGQSSPSLDLALPDNSGAK